MSIVQSEYSGYQPPRPDTKHEDLIVWDQKGIVIMWADGHRSRFSWATLRSACVCNDCQPQQFRDCSLEKHAA
ncbi:MAG TPA: gamma-butyrobetaine hydroxylase-like domain-containing protein [Methylomirabilota bacterium]|jgi:DUF971 family protein|nr:gamma-butyrobetaine hydroxylase-like domain-containing protein [Methylomirabilota bacterium]